MKDPYILENGTLKNLLGISSYEKLKQAEADITYVKLIDSEKNINATNNIELFKSIHKHIFEDIFEWAGEFRTVPIYKREIVIPGVSLEYAKPKDIKRLLNKNMDDLNNINWKDLSIDEISKQFTYYLAKIWRVHPFRDGNTRTTLTFANIFAKQHGFDMDISVMLNELNRVYDPKTNRVVRYSVRDKFVLAALDEKDYPEPQALEAVIKHAIKCGINKKNTELNNMLER